MTEQELREKILCLAKEYAETAHGPPGTFKPGDRVPYGGRVFDADEVCLLVDASLDFWLTAGRYVDLFERKLAETLGAKHCYAVNSGSSANLLSFMTLTSEKLGERRIKRGDEVITVAAAFPTTVAPIIQYGAVPVFVDVTLPSYNIDVAQLDDALTAKTQAVFIAHTLGNPFNVEAVKNFCDKNRLWLIEDNCDALGSRYCLDGHWQLTGTFGDIGTSSFYPSHHITTGEGGAVYTNNDELAKIALSLRDWGRDCWCAPGKDGTCQHRFTRQFGELPLGYDHKYVYSEFGYNLKMTEMQAAIGVAQIDKLPDFIAARRAHWQRLRDELAAIPNFTDWFLLPEPEPNSEPSWFGFSLTVQDDAAPFSRTNRNDIVAYLESHNVQTRMLFAGNLLKHPCFDAMRKSGHGFRVIGDLPQTDRVMTQTFWLGVYPGLTTAMIDYVVRLLTRYFRTSA